MPDLPTLMETPHRMTSPLTADRFRRDSAYKNWRPHGTEDWLLIFTAEGSGEVGTKDHKFATSPGEVILYEPGTPQAYRTATVEGYWDLLWSHFLPRPHWGPWLKWPSWEKGFLHVAVQDPALQRQVRTALQDCIRLARQPQANALDLAFNALERAILWIHAASESGAMDERIRRALDILAEEISHPISLSELAQRCGLSLSRFAHLFREEIGVSPQQYIEKLRLERAAQLLRSTSLSIGEIAEESGYENAFYFSNRFRKTFQQSPTDYRQAARHP